MSTNSGDRRLAARAKVFEVSIIAVDGAEHRGHLLDVSDAGARAHCRTPLVAGQVVGVHANGFHREAIVRWTHADGKAGLQFTRSGEKRPN
jgi:hypothetical protein